VPVRPPVRHPRPGQQERPGQHWLRASLGQAATGAARTDIARKLRNHIRQIQALGFEIALTTAP